MTNPRDPRVLAAVERINAYGIWRLIYSETFGCWFQRDSDPDRKRPWHQKREIPSILAMARVIES